MDWRHSYQRTRKMILDQMYVDRQAGRKIQQADGSWVASGGLSRWDLEDMATEVARKTVERAIRKSDEPAIVLS